MKPANTDFNGLSGILPVLKTIDSSCMIGPTTLNVRGSEYTVDDLGSELDLAEIEMAMVYHSLSKEHDPFVGNERLMDLISGNNRLAPVWVLLPQYTGENGTTEDVLNSMMERDVHLARVFPKDHNFSFTEWGCGTLLSALERSGIPLMIDLGQTSFDQVQAVCYTHPELKLILSDVAYRADRYIYPLLSSFPNLFLETARYQTHRGIEAICEKFGAERLIFGSRVPELSCGPMAMTVRYSKISESWKEQILGGNIARLMEGIGWRN